MHTFIKVAIGLAAYLSVPIAAIAEELKLGHFMSPRHVMHTEMMAPWADEIDKISSGKLKVKIFPGSQLGGRPPAQYKMAVDGAADIAFGLQGYTSSVFPGSTLVELPDFGKDGVENTERFWAIYPKYLVSEYKGVHVLALWVTDEAIIMTKNKPIRTLEDLKGIKVRTPSSMQSKIVAALGGTPIDMPVTEMYNALDRGVVDALWVPASVILDFKLMEVARYFTVGIPKVRSPFFLVMNKGKYDALLPDHKALIDRTTGPKLSIKATSAYKRRADDALEAAKKSGGEIITLEPNEVARWRSALTPLVKTVTAEAEKSGIPANEMLSSIGYLN